MKLPTSEILKRFRIINTGCHLHPKYEANKQPRTKCATCKDMWAARLELLESAGVSK